MKFCKLLRIVIILLLISGCSGEKKEEVKTKEDKTVSKEEMLNLKQEVYTFKVKSFNKQNKVDWALEGESATVVDNLIHINKLKGEYYGDDMTFTLQASKAVYDKVTQDIVLTGDIVGTTSDGGKLVTDHATWNASSEEITTDAHVNITRENINCQGEGALTKPKLKWAQLMTEIRVDFGSGRVITCNGPFELDLEKNVAIFNNNVKIIDKESVMLTDKLTAFLNPDTNEIDRVLTEGNVEIEHRGELDDIGKIGDMGEVSP